MLKYYILLVSLIGFCNSQKSTAETVNSTATVGNTNEVKPGIYQSAQYLPLLNDKKVGVVVNQTSILDDQHLVDYLLSESINVSTIFAPEHGFKGDADAGELITDGKYMGSIPIYSLYGSTKKPTMDMLTDVDVILFDIQDVGARFYTYISTLHYIMEAAAESNIPVIVLDRPNPNGHYVDGPIMEPQFTSFVGMHPVPIVYGMTIGEYAQMINGEAWLANGVQCKLTVIPCLGYSHASMYELPIAPSPNLPNYRSIVLYPSLCLFEGTTVSVGRGTDTQFQVVGHPKWKDPEYAYMPESRYGAKYPKHQDQVCKGWDLTQRGVDEIIAEGQLNLNYIIEAYANLSGQDVPFFNDNNFFEKLAGTSELREQIIAKTPIDQIRESWEAGLAQFKIKRKRYLIYD